jgi:hypothetical protein
MSTISPEQDFRFSLDRAAGLTVDAACACRAAGVLPLPAPHRRLLNRASRALTEAQDALFQARNDPWSTQRPKRHQQLELL